MSRSGLTSMPASSAMPALPGLQNTVSQRGDEAIFQAKACSLPPPPTTSTLSCRKGTTCRNTHISLVIGRDAGLKTFQLQAKVCRTRLIPCQSCQLQCKVCVASRYTSNAGFLPADICGQVGCSCGDRIVAQAKSSGSDFQCRPQSPLRRRQRACVTQRSCDGRLRRFAATSVSMPRRQRIEVACIVKCTAAVKAGFMTDQNPEDEVPESSRKHIDLFASSAPPTVRSQRAFSLQHLHLTCSSCFRKKGLLNRATR